MNALSAAGRERAWEALGAEEFDLLVVGGGITGAGVAREAAGRGLRVAVVEKEDIGSGTSSRSSRLVHGGLRYLETYDFDLVFEALRERRRLLELAPHLVHPLGFLFPIFEGDPTGLVKLGAGMWLYEALSLFRSPRRHRLLGRQGVLEVEPYLRSAGLTGGARYFDAEVDDARLTLAVARAASEADATLVSYARVVGVRAGEPGELSSADIEDALRQRRTRVRARIILNATGPWSDELRRLADPSVAPRLRTTKGVHIVVPRERVRNTGAIIFRSPVDGRVMFVLPWGELTYVGTTDTEYSGDPGAVRAERTDVDYLLRSANSLFPSASLTFADIVSTWAGVRPLLAPEGGEELSESETSREHAIWRDDSGLVNVAGGKLTTYRSMAAETADFVTGILRSEFGVPSGRYYTEYLPLPGAPEEEWSTASQRLASRAMTMGVDAVTANAMARRHGDNIDDVLSVAQEDRSLLAPIVPGAPYIRAEAVHGVRAELALTLEDVMRRRTHLFYERVDGGVGAAREIAELMAPEEGLEWTATDVDEQVAAYEAAVRLTRTWTPSD